MTTLSDAAPELQVDRDLWPDPGDLIAAKAWELLGMTRDEFTRAWYSRKFDGDGRPEIVALDQLMRTGHWNVGPARD